MWNKTPYQFVMRQSYLNPKVWVALDTRQSPLATALSGGLENQSAEWCKEPQAYYASGRSPAANRFQFLT